MKKAIIIGIIIYLLIQGSYLIGINHKTTDEDLIIPTFIDTTPTPNFDTARHYKQNFQRKKNKEVDINFN